MDSTNFIDYYELMQISPSAEPQTIQRVFRMLAARFHPDNPETGDLAHFVTLSEAYTVLSNPKSRADYDHSYNTKRVKPLDVFNLKEFAAGIEGEGNRRMGILCLLYNRRRGNDERPGISLLEFETIMSLPREHLLFTVWYLQGKGLIQRGEESDYAITAAGVDYVEKHLPEYTILYPLLNPAESLTATVAGKLEIEAPEDSEEATESAPASEGPELLQ
jgi:curved DNA-binding protein CbpA